MRITKGLKYASVSNLEAYPKLKKKLEKLKEINPNHLISSENIKKLNYFLVIECKDVSSELGFNKNSNGVAFAFFGEKNKHKKFTTHIRKKNSQPPFFKKIGLLYDITGCYLVATTKSDKRKVTIHKSSNTISCKLNMNNLPEEIKNMCSEFEEYQIEKQRNLYPELQDIFDLNIDERERMIESIVSGIMFSEKPIEEEYPNYNLKDIYDSNYQTKLNIEQVIESKIDEIYDIPFLEQVIESSISSENFELCAKVRDRIEALKNNR